MYNTSVRVCVCVCLCFSSLCVVCKVFANVCSSPCMLERNESHEGVCVGCQAQTGAALLQVQVALSCWWLVNGDGNYVRLSGWDTSQMPSGHCGKVHLALVNFSDVLLAAPRSLVHEEKCFKKTKIYLFIYWIISNALHASGEGWLVLLVRGTESINSSNIKNDSSWGLFSTEGE